MRASRAEEREPFFLTEIRSPQLCRGCPWHGSQLPKPCGARGQSSPRSGATPRSEGAGRNRAHGGAPQIALCAGAVAAATGQGGGTGRPGNGRGGGASPLPPKRGRSGSGCATAAGSFQLRPSTADSPLALKTPPLRMRCARTDLTAAPPYIETGERRVPPGPRLALCGKGVRGMDAHPPSRTRAARPGAF